MRISMFNSQHDVPTFRGQARSNILFCLRCLSLSLYSLFKYVSPSFSELLRGRFEPLRGRLLSCT